MISRSEDFHNGAHHQELTDQWHVKKALTHSLDAMDEPGDAAFRWNMNESNRHAREAGLGSGYGMAVMGLKEKAARGKAYEEGAATPEGDFNEKAKNNYAWWSP